MAQPGTTIEIRIFIKYQISVLTSHIKTKSPHEYVYFTYKYACLSNIKFNYQHHTSNYKSPHHYVTFTYKYAFASNIKIHYQHQVSHYKSPRQYVHFFINTHFYQILVLLFFQGSHFLAEKTATTQKLKKWVGMVGEVGGGLVDVRKSVPERVNLWAR